VPNRRRDAAREFARRLEQLLGDNVRSILLFGSVARGEDDASSDVDLLVIVEDEGEVPDLSEAIGSWMVEHDEVLQLHVVSREDYEELRSRGTAFANTIAREGEALA